MTIYCLYSRTAISAFSKHSFGICCQDSSLLLVLAHQRIRGFCVYALHKSTIDIDIDIYYVFKLM